MELLSVKDLELSNLDKRKYYEDLKRELLKKKSIIKRNSIIRSTTEILLPHMRDYDLLVEGVENIPVDTNCLFVVNHSNAHDVPTLQETMKNLGIQKCFLASSEGLSPAILKLFEECGAILFDRFGKDDARKAFLSFTTELVNGNSGVIFSESTWNLHPYKPMHLIKSGAAYAAAISGKPIVPVIFEYIETDELCKKEKNIFTKCVVTFGKPITISSEIGVIDQTNIIQSAMENLRRSIWSRYGVKKEDFTEEDIMRYLNHTYLKKFGGAAEYDSIRERKVLLVKDQLSSENDYYLDNNGLFVPGVLKKEEGKKYIKKNHFK